MRLRRLRLRLRLLLLRRRLRKLLRKLRRLRRLRCRRGLGRRLQRRLECLLVAEARPQHIRARHRAAIRGCRRLGHPHLRERPQRHVRRVAARRRRRRRRRAALQPQPRERVRDGDERGARGRGLRPLLCTQRERSLQDAARLGGPPRGVLGGGIGEVERQCVGLAPEQHLGRLLGARPVRRRGGAQVGERERWVAREESRGVAQHEVAEAAHLLGRGAWGVGSGSWGGSWHRVTEAAHCSTRCVAAAAAAAATGAAAAAAATAATTLLAATADIRCGLIKGGAQHGEGVRGGDVWGDEGGGGGGGGSGVGRGGEWAWRAVECRRQRGAGVEEAIKLEE